MYPADHVRRPEKCHHQKGRDADGAGHLERAVDDADDDRLRLSDPVCAVDDLLLQNASVLMRENAWTHADGEMQLKRTGSSVAVLSKKRWRSGRFAAAGAGGVLSAISA